jgi:glycosyltransferase involved in cell wall biosynthesis
MISIVTTCYNLEGYIEKCITSILNQSYDDIELIIVNDCSTDNSLTVIDKFLYDTRIKLINNKENVGAGKSRKIGIENCNGDYLILIDGDDWITSDYLKILCETAKKNDADIVAGHLNCTKYKCKLGDTQTFITEDDKIYYL